MDSGVVYRVIDSDSNFDTPPLGIVIFKSNGDSIIYDISNNVIDGFAQRVPNGTQLYWGQTDDFNYLFVGYGQGVFSSGGNIFGRTYMKILDLDQFDYEDGDSVYLSVDIYLAVSRFWDDNIETM